MANFYTAWDTTTEFSPTSMGAVPERLDLAIAVIKNMIVYCSGAVSYATGTLTWSGTLTFCFNDENGKLMKNSASAGSIAISSGSFAYIDLVDVDGSVVSVSTSTLTSNAASQTVAINRVVLGYHDATGGFFPVALTQIFSTGGATTFTGLSDVPSTYSGASGKAVTVNPSGTGLIFTSAGVGTFIKLSDCPATYSGATGYYVTVNSSATGLIFSALPALTTTFIALTDTPSSYSGKAGQIVSVNASASGLEFISSGSAGISVFTALTDVPNSYLGAAGKAVTVNASATGLVFTSAGAGGATTFVSLTDVPSAYAGAGGYTVKVNASATGLVFSSVTAGSSGITFAQGLIFSLL